MVPKGMGALTKLRTSSAFIIQNDDGRTIKELMNLKTPRMAEKAKLSEKVIRGSKIKMDHHDDNGILEKLKPNTKLKHLKISCYSGEKFPDWICNPLYEMLITIILYKCDNTEILPSLGQLPSLKFLSLMEMKNEKKIRSQFRGSSGISSIVAFPKLERLKIIGFPLLERWNEANGDYTHLNELVIENNQFVDVIGYFDNRWMSFDHKEVEKFKANKWCNIEHVQSVWINQEEIITIN
ncbi:putative disease resistance protein RGA3 [Bienertia sinuspersici]